MDEKEAVLHARLALHESLLVMLWTRMLLTSPDPEVAVSVTMSAAMDDAMKAWTTQPSRALAPEVIPRLLQETENFWLKVQMQVERYLQGP